MCLITHKSNQPQVATKDITCYKLLSVKVIDNIKLYISIFYSYEWELNKLNKTEIKIEELNMYTSDEDACYWNSIAFETLKQEAELHNIKLNHLADSHLADSFNFEKIKNSNQFNVISKGFHSIVKHPTLLETRGSTVFECTIPKGATYYTSGYEYVSDQLIINKIIA